MNLSKIKAHLSKDIILKRVISKITPDWNANNDTDLYLSLIRSVIGQQLSVKAADTIFKRFLDAFTNNYPSKKELISTDVGTLREKGLSIQKAKYVKNIAAYFLSEENKDTKWDELSDQEIIKQLTTIKGVGKWTVEMILMFSLNRPDIFPEGDLGIQNGMKALYHIDAKNKKELILKMNEIAEHWKPYRTYASRYIWAAKDAL